jgi:predicted phosphodiesterase
MNTFPNFNIKYQWCNQLPKSVNRTKSKRPKIFICGHSHILLVQYLKDIDCLHLNPGAAGKQGWHKVQTLLKFQIDGPEIKNMEVVELKRNASV